MSKSNSSGGSNFLELLAIVFIVLKLIGIIKWSWLLVLTPIWIPILLIIIAVIVVEVFK